VDETGPVCSRPFRLPVPHYPIVLRFHTLLVEPDRRVSRIRLPAGALLGVRSAPHWCETVRASELKRFDTQIAEIDAMISTSFPWQVSAASALWSRRFRTFA